MLITIEINRVSGHLVAECPAHVLYCIEDIRQNNAKRGNRNSSSGRPDIRYSRTLNLISGQISDTYILIDRVAPAKYKFAEPDVPN